MVQSSLTFTAASVKPEKQVFLATTKEKKQEMKILKTYIKRTKELKPEGSSRGRRKSSSSGNQLNIHSKLKSLRRIFKRKPGMNSMISSNLTT